MGKKSEEKEDTNTPTEDKSTENKKIENTKQETSTKPSEETKSKGETNDVDSLRQVIKLGSSQNETKQTSSDVKPNVNPPKTPSNTDSLDNLSAKGALELKREILQRIKDFDFQIKKNHEELENLNQRLDSVTKDLDDLVSLYEIVSEQMNPFVGLSSVTKKRIEALENYTTEIESVKQRLAELEAFAEKFGVKLKKPITKPEKRDLDIKLSDEEVDRIIEETFDEFSLYPEVDDVIDRFIENIKTGG